MNTLRKIENGSQPRTSERPRLRVLGFKKGAIVSSGAPTSKADRRCVLAVMADTDQSFLVLVFAPDDGHWCALAVRMSGDLACDGDVVPGESSVRMGFDDSLFGRKSGHVSSAMYRLVFPREGGALAFLP